MLSVLQTAHAKDFVICHEREHFLPYFTSKFDGGVVGVLPDLLTQATLAAGVTPKYVGFPWKRCLELLKNNEVDGIFPLIYLKTRKVLGKYPMVAGKEDLSRRLGQVDYSIFTSRDNPVQWNGAFSKENQPIIGAQLGYVVVQSLKEKHNIKATTGLDPLRGFQLVALGRLNAYVTEKTGGEVILRQEGLADKVITLKPMFENRFWHLMISHKFYSEFPKISEAIWDQLKVQREQNFSKLMKKYLDSN